MATRAASQVSTIGKGAYVYEWTGLLNGDDGAGVEVVGFSEKVMQVLGTFGVGGTVQGQGAIAGTIPAAASTDWVAMTDAQGEALGITSAKVEQIMEALPYFRPKVTAGDGDTNLTVRLYLYRAPR